MPESPGSDSGGAEDGVCTDLLEVNAILEAGGEDLAAIDTRSLRAETKDLAGNPALGDVVDQNQTLADMIDKSYQEYVDPLTIIGQLGAALAQTGAAIHVFCDEEPVLTDPGDDEPSKVA